MSRFGLEAKAVLNQRSIDAIQASPNRYKFVCRRFGFSASGDKDLTRAEADRLIKSGLKIVSVYQDTGNRAEHFSHSLGELDAEAAYSYARYTINQPKGSVIYFSVDYNPTPSEIYRRIVPYFKAIKEVLNDYDGYYQSGVYGSGPVCKIIKQKKGLASYSWLSRIEGNQGYDEPSMYNIKRCRTCRDIDGIRYDMDVTGSGVSYGQWPSLRQRLIRITSGLTLTVKGVFFSV